MPVFVSGGGSSSSAPGFETTEKICFMDLLLDQVNNLESKKLGLGVLTGGRREGGDLREACQVAGVE
jgi:hypothetical protein